MILHGIYRVLTCLSFEHVLSSRVEDKKIHQPHRRPHMSPQPAELQVLQNLNSDLRLHSFKAVKGFEVHGYFSSGKRCLVDDVSGVAPGQNPVAQWSHVVSTS